MANKKSKSPQEKESAHSKNEINENAPQEKPINGNPLNQPASGEPRDEVKAAEGKLPPEAGGQEQELGTTRESLEKEIAELKDRLLRKQAEFENFRKRLIKDKEEAIKYANQMLLLDLVTVIDDFERAIQSSVESKDFNVFHEGIELIEKQLISMLEKKWGLSRFESIGEGFDPEKHQAIAMEESQDHKNPTVIEDYQKGYLYFERVLRPAKVKVGKPLADSTSNGNT